jgi:YesN/AraC family two-component response regulator
MKYSTDQVITNIDNRSTNTLRSKKNNMLAFNTICRKGAERGNVHPVHLDEMSRRMAILIENMTSPNQVQDVHREILKKYCNMVQRNSTTGYSPTMQKVINHIMLSLTDTDLTLQSTADSLGLNKSYLATLFKKETGKTFTTYVNDKRIDHAIFLLNSSDLQVQEIASSCGIPDVTYFTRIFKKEKGMTPKQYRKMLSQK